MALECVERIVRAGGDVATGRGATVADPLVAADSAVREPGRPGSWPDRASRVVAAAAGQRRAGHAQSGVGHSRPRGARSPGRRRMPGRRVARRLARGSPEAAAHAVANDGGADLAADRVRDSGPGVAGKVGHAYGPRRARRDHHAVERRRSHGRGHARSGRQSCAAPLAAGSNDRLARPGPHAMAEPVPLGPASVVGLVRALHCVPPLPRGLLARAGPAATRHGSRRNGNSRSDARR